MATPHLAWLLIKILNPMHKILTHLEYEDTSNAQIKLGAVGMPYLSEFFPFLLQSRESTLRRKGRVSSDI